MGWAKRLSKRAEDATDRRLGQDLERLDALRLGSLAGCLELARELRRAHARAGRDLRGDERKVHELEMAAGEGLVRDNLTLLFDLMDADGPRTLLAQAALGMYAFDPCSVVVTTQDFDEQMAEWLAVRELVERLATAEGVGFDRLLKDLPENLSARVVSFGLLDAMDRPLGLLAPGFRAGDLGVDLPGVRFDGVLIERDLEHGGPGRRLVLQSGAASEAARRALEAAEVDWLFFPEEEILGSFRPGAAIVEQVRERWGWRPLGEAPEEPRF